MTSTSAANQGWLWLSWGSVKLGSLGGLGRSGELDTSFGGGDVRSEGWVVWCLGCWRVWDSGNWDGVARWGSSWSSSPPPCQWCRGARRRPAIRSISGRNYLENGSFLKWDISRRWIFRADCAVFLVVMPHAVIPKSHLFVAEQELGIGVSLIIGNLHLQPPPLSIPLFQLETTLTAYFHVEMWQPRMIYFLESNIASYCARWFSRSRVFPISSKNSRYPRKSSYFTTIYINAKNSMGLPQLGEQTPIILKKENSARKKNIMRKKRYGSLYLDLRFDYLN